MTIDVGSNLSSLGFAWLFLHYLLPVAIGIALIGVGILGIKYLISQLPYENRNLTWLLLFGLFVLLIVIYAL